VWVAEVGASVVGFVAVELHHPERSMGEISMLAVDPDYQGLPAARAPTWLPPPRVYRTSTSDAARWSFTTVHGRRPKLLD
jgi:hypothetical protein